MKHWTHLHSVGAGGIIAVALATHFLWMLTAVFVLGIIVGRSWRALGKASQTVGGAALSQVRILDERWKTERARRRAFVDKSLASREKLERAHKLGVIEGMDYQR